MSKKSDIIMATLAELYPDAACELIHKNVLELTIAVMLSAQTTDRQVNIATKGLFEHYKTITDYANAKFEDVVEDIKSIGLNKVKAKNVITMAQLVQKNYGGEIPDSIKKLITLPGIGRKTANVVISVGYGKPGFAVDTHVERVCKRLSLVKESDDVVRIEKKVKRLFPREQWSLLHHQMIFFGRYFCKARNPNCEQCTVQKQCSYYKNQNKKS
ncbi:endonuclease III [Erysipelotrichaceae bacterium]|nr:endonuclease III [Erysipelotrichaceae bacterium]